MKFTFKALVITIFVASSLLFAASPKVLAQQEAVPVPSSTTTQDDNTSIGDKICQGVISTETGRRDPNTTIEACTENGDKSFSGLTRRIIDIFSIVVGSVSVIMIIIGGFRYIISGGDSTGVTSAKNTILYAIVGLVIVLFSQIIIRFIISNFRPA